MSFNKKIKAGDKFKGIPRHVAIIMDGNGRWARNHMIGRLKGHEKGANVAKKVVSCCCELGVPALTLYAFSTENWKRPHSEVHGIMRILLKFLKSEQKFLSQNDVRLSAIGQLYRLPSPVRKMLHSVIDNTSQNRGMQLNLALSYGGRTEITDAVLRIASEVKKGVIDLKSITLDLVSNYISTCGLPDPDVLIRTGGEMRVSNFLLWQIAYTEIFFTKTLWPDFGAKELTQIIREFPKRNRRFGSLVS